MLCFNFKDYGSCNRRGCTFNHTDATLPDRRQQQQQRYPPMQQGYQQQQPMQQPPPMQRAQQPAQEQRSTRDIFLDELIEKQMKEKIQQEALASEKAEIRKQSEFIKIFHGVQQKLTPGGMLSEAAANDLAEQVIQARKNPTSASSPSQIGLDSLSMQEALTRGDIDRMVKSGVTSNSPGKLSMSADVFNYALNKAVGSKRKLFAIEKPTIDELAELQEVEEREKAGSLFEDGECGPGGIRFGIYEDEAKKAKERFPGGNAAQKRKSALELKTELAKAGISATMPANEMQYKDYLDLYIQRRTEHRLAMGLKNVE